MDSGEADSKLATELMRALWIASLDTSGTGALELRGLR